MEHEMGTGFYVRVFWVQGFTKRRGPVNVGL